MKMIDADALIANKFKNDISYNAFVNLVKRQPTIEPERKRGEWKDRGEDYMIRWICSECGRKETHVYNFCPDCGADMRGGETDV